MPGKAQRPVISRLIAAAELAVRREGVPMADRTRWFSDCGWGVFCHWLGAAPSSDGGAELTAEAWNSQVDAFDDE